MGRGLAAESLYRAYVASTLHGAFGSSAERKGSLSVDVRNQPGPAHYQPPIAAPCSAGPPRGRLVRGTSNFTSQSLRIKKPEHLVRSQRSDSEIYLTKRSHRTRDRRVALVCGQ